MNDKSIKNIQAVIEKWRQNQLYTYHQKEVIVSSRSPISSGEFVLRFKNSLSSFYCNGKLIPVELISHLFHTTTLGEERLTDNPNADTYRLEKFLNEFDSAFELHVTEELSKCHDLLESSDPLFF